MWPRESEEAQRSAPLEPRKIRNPNRFTLLPSTPVERLLCPTQTALGSLPGPRAGPALCRRGGSTPPSHQRADTGGHSRPHCRGVSSKATVTSPPATLCRPPLTHSACISCNELRSSVPRPVPQEGNTTGTTSWCPRPRTLTQGVMLTPRAHPETPRKSSVTS